MAKPRKPARRKPYRKPTLEHYGNLRMITTLSWKPVQNSP